MKHPCYQYNRPELWDKLPPKSKAQAIEYWETYMDYLHSKRPGTEPNLNYNHWPGCATYDYYNFDWTKGDQLLKPR
jgi:hypothetical protein